MIAKVAIITGVVLAVSAAALVACVATTGALGVAGVVRETDPIALMDLTHAGAVGGRMEACYEWAAPQNAPLVIGPGQLLVVSNPAAMDAAGTWQLTVGECHWIEATRASQIG